MSEYTRWFNDCGNKDTGAFRHAWQGARETREACLASGDLTGAVLARLSMRRWVIRYLFARTGIQYAVPSFDNNASEPKNERPSRNNRRRKEPITDIVTYVWQKEVMRKIKERRTQ